MSGREFCRALAFLLTDLRDTGGKAAYSPCYCHQERCVPLEMRWTPAVSQSVYESITGPFLSPEVMISPGGGNSGGHYRQLELLFLLPVPSSRHWA